MKKFLLSALLMLTLSSTFSQVSPSPVIMGTEVTGEHFKIVFLADGYQDTELGDFDTDAQTVKTAILGLAPFDSNTGKINFYKVRTESDDSGQSRLAGGDPFLSAINKDTYWGVTSNSGGLERYLEISSTTRNLIESEYGDLSGGNKVFVLVISNHDAYGGYGDLPSYPTWSTYETSLSIVNADSSFLGFLAMHEFAGHSFGDLDDEYIDSVFANSGDPFLSHPNRLNVFDTGDQPAGWLEGARYVPTGKWRYGNGLMKSVAYDFHAYNEALVQDRIDDEAKTIIGTSFSLSRTSTTSSLTACNINTFAPNTKYHNGQYLLPEVNDYIYNNIHGTDEFNGRSYYWKYIQGGLTYKLKIASNGKVLSVAWCSGLQQ